MTFQQGDDMTLRVFKCPFCGYRFRADPEGRYEAGVAKGDSQADKGVQLIQGLACHAEPFGCAQDKLREASRSWFEG